MHRKAISLSVAVLTLVVTSVSRAAIIAQSFDARSGDNTFTVNQFDAEIGVLTRVTFTVVLETWGGYYAVESTAISGTVLGEFWVGMKGTISGLTLPAGLDTSLSVTTSDNFSLPTLGSSARIEGPIYANRVSQSNTANASPANFSSYEGLGTYSITFGVEHFRGDTAEGQVKGSFASAYSAGSVTVIYEYDPVPEPTTWGLVVLGVVALAARCRRVPH